MKSYAFNLAELLRCNAMHTIALIRYMPIIYYHGAGVTDEHTMGLKVLGLKVYF